MGWFDEILDLIWLIFDDWLLANATLVLGVILLVASVVLCYWGRQLGAPWEVRLYCLAGVSALGGVALIWRWASPERR